MNFAIIGCGLIGRKRLQSLKGLAKVIYTCDLNETRAQELSQQNPEARAITRFEDVLVDPSVDVVIISTLNASLAPIALAAVKAGKHVLVEKPGALNSLQLREIAAAAEISGSKVRIGYNHRFHPSLQKASEIIKSGVLGQLMFMRGRYGHGGRTGYDREWRADPALSGGGELIDQGVHLIDLAGWFFGEFKTIEGHASTLYWDMKVDDNAFLLLRTENGQTAWLHVSCTEWKNLFSLEIYGRDGKLSIDGLGGSYGPEKLTYYKMLPEMGPPEITSWEYVRGDDSWKLEINAFMEDIRSNRTPVPGLRESLRTLEIVEEIYKKSGYPKP
jgi:predicted dehydrogenase